MSKPTLVVLSALVSVFSSAYASVWQPPSEAKTVKVCGSIGKENTVYDGVRVVFEEKDAGGKVIDRSYLSPLAKSLEQEFANMRLGDKMESCVVGVKSERRPIDSPREIHTFETF